MSDRVTKLLWNLAKGVLIALIFAFFAWLLSKKLKGLTLEDLYKALTGFPAWRIALAGGLTVLNYLVLVGYDYLAVRYLKHPISSRKIAFASFVGYAMSYNFGWIVGGSTVRYRLYSAWGFSNLEIAKLIATLTLTFWVGVFTVAGVAFVTSPLEIPPNLFEGHLAAWLPIKTAFPLGVGSLVFISSYLLLCGLWHRPLKWGKHEFTPPELRFSLLQIAVASLDQLIGAAVFYTLLPDEVRRDITYFQTVNVYLLFTVVSALLHIPGGLIVLEQIVLDFIPSNDQADLAASLIVYRVIFYLIPLLIAGGMMLWHEWRHHTRGETSRPAKPVPSKH